MRRCHQTSTRLRSPRRPCATWISPVREAQRILFLFAVVGVSLPAAGALAAPGQADLSFGTNGVAITNEVQLLGYPANGARVQVARGTDGKFVVAAQILMDSFTSALGCGVLRYNSDGTLDTSFGFGGGVLLTADPCSSSCPLAIVRQAETVPNVGLFIRDAVPCVPTIGSPSLLCGGVVVQNDGGIIVSGGARSFCTPSTFAAFFGGFARLTANGSVDTSFGNGGIVFLSVPSSLGQMILQPDGKLMSIGVRHFGHSSEDILIARLEPAGALDTTFGGGAGWVAVNVFDRDNGGDLALQPDGKIVAVGARELDGTLNDWVALRFDSNGALDSTFGSSGVVVTDMSLGESSMESAFAAAVQSDGKILSGGVGREGAQMVRYLPGGALDASFGTSGKLTLPTGGTVTDLDLQWNGKIVVAGRGSLVGRLLEDGSMDPDFGTDGRATPGPPGAVNSALIEPSGRIVVAFQGSGGVGLAAYEGDPPPTPTPTVTPTSLPPTPTLTPTLLGPASGCPPGPLSSCDTPRRSRLTIVNGEDDTQDSFALTLWRSRPRRNASAFGNPPSHTTTFVCLYSQGQLVTALAIPPGARWQPVGQRGFAYEDPSGSVQGIREATLERRTGWLAAHETSIRLQAFGARLPDVALPLAQPLDVVVQVHNDATPICWGETFTGTNVETNASRVFRARKP